MGEATRPGVQTDKLFQERRHGHQPQEPKLLWIVREALETLVPPDWRLAEAAEAAVAVG